MARRHFAIEPPRRISISIEGYDPGAQGRLQQRRQQKRSRRRKRQVEAGATPQPATATGAGTGSATQGREQLDDLDALNMAAACRPPTGPADDLRRAFAAIEDALASK